VFAAKFLSTVDYLNGGRLIVGVGAGWWSRNSTPWECRSPSCAADDEYLKVYRNL
jgi:alkanesulfonate monooxygenase SsuD/methylene tetrahydromethanopterin reductase-like flavin-dependent oxidoreductase (luciferase family)